MFKMLSWFIKKVFESLRPSGIIVFHERFWPGYNGIAEKNSREYDLHPIRLSDSFGHWMATEFDLIYEKEQRERWGNMGYYWIGRKRNIPMELTMIKVKHNLQEHVHLLQESGFVETNIWGNIYNAQDTDQPREYASYARLPWINTICEIGFAGGHSTVVFQSANSNAKIYSFDDFGKETLTIRAYELLRKKGHIRLFRGNSIDLLPKFAKTNPSIFCDLISIDGSHHSHFPLKDLNNFKFLANYPNIVLIDDFHSTDWPDVYNGAMLHVKQGSLKLRHVSKSSVHFRNKQKQWAVGEYQLLTIICLSFSLKRLAVLKKLIRIGTNHPVVQHFIIVWNGSDAPQEIRVLEKHPDGYARVTIVETQKNSLNNRYDPKLPVHTGAVMILDDDVEIDSSTISCAFYAWKRDPVPLFSFGAGRIVSSKMYISGDVHDKMTNFLLPRMIFHRKYLDVYFQPEYGELRDYVDNQEAHCDDIAFSSVVTKFTQRPIYQLL